MDENRIRELCAQEATQYIQSGFIVGLGAGRNIFCLVEKIKEKGIKIKVVTPSDSTRSLCTKSGIEVLPTYLVDTIDVAFDGCGEVDSKFHASKGGGGVHTKEKLIGRMAKEYILLIDDKKLTDKLSYKYTVCIEVIKDSLSYVEKKVKELKGVPTVRTSPNKDGYLISDDGCFLIDIKFEEIDDFKKLNEDLEKIHGIVGTSIFIDEVTKVIVGGENGVEVLSRR